tara:strand:+ start:923 stop:1297 length:375 start_codon:yes stop_codon:yes gene_type:complete
MSFFKIVNQKYSNVKLRIPFPLIDIYYFKWNESKTIPIHNHANKGCLMFLMKGSIYEKLYNENFKLKRINQYISPSISYINNKLGLHSIKPEKGSQSLHFYYPKGHKTKYFNNNNETNPSITNS